MFLYLTTISLFPSQMSVPNLCITKLRRRKKSAINLPSESINLKMIVQPSTESMRGKQTIELTLRGHINLRRINRGDQVEIRRARTDHFEVVAKLITGRINSDNPSVECLRCHAAENLIIESKLYTTVLRQLQGVVVPRFLGLYAAEGNLCMLLEYCGMPANYDWISDDILKSAIYECVVLESNFPGKNLT